MNFKSLPEELPPDVKDGLAELRKQKLIGEKAVVSGGSAGGYTVQRLLTYYPDMFAAGASPYGIRNLITLQNVTHKFESHYLEQLIGGTLESNLKEYEERDLNFKFRTIFSI